MRQLTSLDTQFLALESQTHVGHVGGLAFVDASTAPNGTVDCSSIKDVIAERLPLLPPMRWRLAEVPLGLDYPYWVDDPEFDLDFHVREIGLAAPGSDAQLTEQTARIMSRRLDRARPLWELYVIHGHESGHVVVLTKIHHAVIDGMSGAEIMGILLDVTPEGRDVSQIPPMTSTEPPPGTAELLGRGLLGLPRYPARLLRAMPSTLSNIEDTPWRQLPGAGIVGRAAGVAAGAIAGGDGRTPDRGRFTAPKTSFNGRITPHRRFAFGQLDLDDVKHVKSLHGSTVNDVVVSICAGAVRRWLIKHDELPDQPLVAQVPVSVRSAEEAGTYGNRILLLAAPLFTDEADPVQRLHRTHEALATMKSHHKALPATLLQDANHFIPPALFSRAARLTFGLSTSRAGAPNWNLVISNVPGPQFPLYLAGAKLVANYPVSVITDGMGLNITVMSYCGKMDFGIVADREQMPDVHELIGWLDEELELLKTG